KGYEIEPGTFVVLTNEDLMAIQPKASRNIEVGVFVPAAAIAPVWFERSYFLGPASHTESYAALVEAMRSAGRVGIARWTVRNRTYHGALRATDHHLVLATLRARNEVVSIPKVPVPASSGGARDLSLAEQLVGALTADFEPRAFNDE